LGDHFPSIRIWFNCVVDALMGISIPCNIWMEIKLYCCQPFKYVLCTLLETLSKHEGKHFFLFSELTPLASI
jgi:hypothetical protein